MGGARIEHCRVRGGSSFHRLFDRLNIEFSCSLEPGSSEYTMTLDDVVARVSKLPADFYAGSKSIVQLISESGVERFPLALSVPRISNYIIANPQVVDDWLRWSENKRVSAGWYFIRRSSGFVCAC
jgi:hypothetical protein